MGSAAMWDAGIPDLNACHQLLPLLPAQLPTDVYSGRRQAVVPTLGSPSLVGATDGAF